MPLSNRNRVARIDQSSSSHSSRRSHRSRRSHTSSNSQVSQRLADMGFEEGELEMFFDTTDFSENDLVNKYLEIAQHPPYNLNWNEQRARLPNNYMIGVYKRNGVEYTKHDIVEDTLTYFYDQIDQGRAEGIRKKKRGTSKILRKQKKRYTRRHRTRHRRRSN